MTIVLLQIYSSSLSSAVASIVTTHKHRQIDKNGNIEIVVGVMKWGY